MSRVLKAVSAVFIVDGKEVSVWQGQALPDGLSDEQIAVLERNDALEPEGVQAVPASDDVDGVEVHHDPSRVPPFSAPPTGRAPTYASAAAAAPGGSGQTLTAADVDSLDAAALSQRLSDSGAKASDVVALGDTPERAAKLIDAEQTAHGGDGRKTVVEPLQKVAGRSDDSQ